MYYSIYRLKPNVYHIQDPLGVFMTLIVGERQALLLDSGYGIGNLRKAIAEITDLPLILVNSHGHLDHVLGNHLFNQTYLHKADHQIYRNHSSQERKRLIIDQQRSRPEGLPKDFNPDVYLSERDPKVLPVDEGHIFDLVGVRLTVIHIPGHTPGGIALLDDRDRLLLTGDAISPHVWMFLKESTSIATYIQSLQKLHTLRSEFDGIIASHVPKILPNVLIDRLINCAQNIDPEKSVPFEAPFKDAGKGLMYFEGVDSLREGLGIDTLDLATQPLFTFDLNSLDFSDVRFVSIVYSMAKL